MRELRNGLKIALVFSLVLAARPACGEGGDAAGDISSSSTLGELSSEYDPGGKENNPYQGGYESADSAHSAPQPDFSPASSPAENPGEAGALDTNFEPEIVQGSFQAPPDTPGGENPYRGYGSFSDSRGQSESRGSGSGGESDLIGQRSSEYEPEPPYGKQ